MSTKSNKKSNTNKLNPPKGASKAKAKTKVDEPVVKKINYAPMTLKSYSQESGKDRFYLPQIGWSPVDLCNQYLGNQVLQLLLSKGNFKIIDGDLTEWKAKKQVALIHYVDNANMVSPYFELGEDDQSSLFNANIRYTPFMVFCMLRYKGNHAAATVYIQREFQNLNMRYIRVGTEYYKLIDKKDRYGLKWKELKKWTKEAFADDNSRDLLQYIMRYDDFTIYPSNVNYQAVIGNAYNLYTTFSHKPKKGDWKWIGILLKHIFGEQYDLGVQYLQALYMYPERPLPILVIASEERATGKSTFVNFLSMLFGNNAVVISIKDMQSNFNSAYGRANVISIEETQSDKTSLVDQLKMYATADIINFNAKFRDNLQIPFFGHFVITSNNVDKFLRVDEAEVRFWVRTVEKPNGENKNTFIKEELFKEIPAFLHHLRILEGSPETQLDYSRDRALFTPEQIRTDALMAVVEESRIWLYKELDRIFQSIFENNPEVDHFYITPIDIKEIFFENDHNANASYIGRVLKKEMKFTWDNKVVYRKPFSDEADMYNVVPIFMAKKNGRFIKINRDRYISDDDANELRIKKEKRSSDSAYVHKGITIGKPRR